MYARKMKPLFASICLVIAVLLFFGILARWKHTEREECICTILAEDDASSPFDARLSSIIDINTLTPGTFVQVKTQCQHDVHLWITIFVDEGYYEGTQINLGITSLIVCLQKPCCPASRIRV